MAKKSATPAPNSGSGKVLRVGQPAKSEEAPADPLAGMSQEERKPILAAAARADEGARAEGPRGLVVDPEKKAKALSMIGTIAAADVRVRAARLARASAADGDAAMQAVVDARAKRAALKTELNALYLEAPDSVQAAETEAAAGQ